MDKYIRTLDIFINHELKLSSIDSGICQIITKEISEIYCSSAKCNECIFNHPIHTSMQKVNKEGIYDEISKFINKDS